MKSFNLLRSSPMIGDGPDRFYIDGKPASKREYDKLDNYAWRQDSLLTRSCEDRWHYRKVVYL
jgi:hypothetical protein